MAHYPNRLLPRPNYKKITIPHAYVRFLTRFTPDKDFWDPDTDTVKVKSFCSPKENLFDYSTSLLGVFQPEDNYIKIVGDNFNYFTTDWLEGETVSEPNFEKDFIIVDERGYFFLDIDQLLNQWESLPYEKDGETYFVAPMVIHTPKNANFWHVSVQWTDENGEVFVKEKNKKWKGKMINKIREYFKEFAFRETPYFEEIPEAGYIKTED